MYRFTKNDGTHFTLNNPTWITSYNNGCYGMCSIEDAFGVLINGVVYHITGKPDMPDVDSVDMSEITEYQYQNEQLELQIQTEMAIAELSILIAGLQQKE